MIPVVIGSVGFVLLRRVLGLSTPAGSSC